MNALEDHGYVEIAPSEAGRRWVQAARQAARGIAATPAIRARNLRHGQTWFVGVDALPNAEDGAISRVALPAEWRALAPELPLHAGQLSIVYPGYPGRDPDESDGNHRYRRLRSAAHVDGLLPEGPQRRRFAREYHAYVLGIPLGAVQQAPTVVWRGSHKIMQAALIEAIGGKAVENVDVTDAYQAARRVVFDACTPVPMSVGEGGAFVVHRFALHGTAPWQGTVGQARAVAFFRPEFSNANDWLYAGLRSANRPETDAVSAFSGSENAP
ncbi:MAG: hypothetical protein AAF601_12450 [Pseudomonadota bacterium]